MSAEQDKPSANAEPAPTPSRAARRDVLIGGLGVSAAAAAAGVFGWSRKLRSAPAAAVASAPPAPSSSAVVAPSPELEPLNRFPRMVQEHFARLVREAELLGEKRRAALNSAAAAQGYVRDTRTRIARVFGTWPARTPLKARVTGVLERDSYRIEKVIYESRPNFPVTANLYVPKGRRFPLPGVIGMCGHADSGKASYSYQAFAQSLARMGYVVLIYDPISQAERVQLYSAQDKPIAGRSGVSEHTRMGMHLALVGDSLTAWMAWDGIRAIDYLLSRREVDPRHLGVTGNSGGGTQTTWLAAADPRVTMAAPSCFVTTFRRNFENELLSDAEQCPTHALAEGLDHSDFLAALAPKPLLLLGRELDFFDVRGLEEAHGRLRQLYKLFGAEEKLGLFVGPGGHNFGTDNREAMYRFFNRFTKISQTEQEPPVKAEEEKDLWCTPEGRVFDQRSKNLVSVIAERVATLRASRGTPRGAELRQRVTRVLALNVPSGAPDSRILRPLPQSRQYPRRNSLTYLVEGEAGIHVPVTMVTPAEMMSRPPQGVPRALLYVSHQSADAELRKDPWLKELSVNNPGVQLYACDVRGIGDSRSNVSVQGGGGPEYFYAVHGLMLDKPYVGQRTLDVLSVLAWLKAQGHQSVHLVAKGWGAVPGVFAALLSELVSEVTLKNALTSLGEVAETEGTLWSSALFAFDMLREFDLPDCYAELADKKLRQIEPMPPKRHPSRLAFPL